METQVQADPESLQTQSLLDHDPGSTHLHRSGIIPLKPTENPLSAILQSEKGIQLSNLIFSLIQTRSIVPISHRLGNLIYASVQNTRLSRENWLWYVDLSGIHAVENNVYLKSLGMRLARVAIMLDGQLFDKQTPVLAIMYFPHTCDPYQHMLHPEDILELHFFELKSYAGRPSEVQDSVWKHLDKFLRQRPDYSCMVSSVYAVSSLTPTHPQLYESPDVIGYGIVPDPRQPWTVHRGVAAPTYPGHRIPGAQISTVDRPSRTAAIAAHYGGDPQRWWQQQVDTAFTRLRDQVPEIQAQITTGEARLLHPNLSLDEIAGGLAQICDEKLKPQLAPELTLSPQAWFNLRDRLANNPRQELPAQRGAFLRSAQRYHLERDPSAGLSEGLIVSSIAFLDFIYRLADQSDKALKEQVIELGESVVKALIRAEMSLADYGIAVAGLAQPELIPISILGQEEIRRRLDLDYLLDSICLRVGLDTRYVPAFTDPFFSHNFWIDILNSLLSTEVSTTQDKKYIRRARDTLSDVCMPDVPRAVNVSDIETGVVHRHEGALISFELLNYTQRLMVYCIRGRTVEEVLERRSSINYRSRLDTIANKPQKYLSPPKKALQVINSYLHLLSVLGFKSQLDLHPRRQYKHSR